jgi:hypothetical protein
MELLERQHSIDESVFEANREMISNDLQMLEAQLKLEDNKK